MQPSGMLRGERPLPRLGTLIGQDQSVTSISRASTGVSGSLKMAWT